MIEKRYYTLTEVALQLRVKLSWIRYYDNLIGISTKRRRSYGGGRLFTPDQVEVLRALKKTHNTKYFTVEGMKYIASNKRILFAFAKKL